MAVPVGSGDGQGRTTCVRVPSNRIAASDSPVMFSSGWLRPFCWQKTVRTAQVAVRKGVIVKDSSFCEDDWEKRLIKSHAKRTHRKNVVDDGFYSLMAKGARFTDGLEFPVLEDPGDVLNPLGVIPFSKLTRSKDGSECVIFFEKDPMFADAIVAVDDFVKDLRRFPCLATPDCSLYRDSPLVVQLSNLYLSRLFGHYCQKLGMTVIPTCRWGDERTYTDELFKVPPAFDGLPKGSVYWVGTYGVSKHAEDKRHLKAGLESMIKWLEPKKILLYGSKPHDVFDNLDSKCEFILYRDWTTQVKGGHSGQR